MPNTSARGPLSGIRVVELAGIGPAPYACMLLADMGAEVIRVDRPGAVAPAGGPDLLGRGKRSVVLDLKRPEAVEVVLTLAAGADVLVEGFRPGVTERLGVGPEAVWVRNPKLVYGRMTGWGQDGPLASRAGHDIDYIAPTGALHAIGPAGGPPQIPLNLVGDYGGGSTFLVIGVLAAVLEARTTGRGQVVDAAIIDGASHLLAQMYKMRAAGHWSDERGANLFDGGVPFYSVYETADGQHMAVGPLEPQFYAEFLRLLEIDPSVADPADQQDRSRWPQLRETFARVFARRTRAEWSEIFDGTDACVAPVLSLSEAPTHSHIAARGSVTEVDGVLQPGLAPRFSKYAEATVGRTPSRQGQHTTEVLAAAGLDAQKLIEAGVAVQA